MKIDEGVELGPRCTLGVGGPARYFAAAESEADVIEALGWAARRGIPVRVLGGGSNLVIADDGFDGLVLAMRLRGKRRMNAGSDVELEVAAGEPWDELVAACVNEELAGIECLSGIPGLAGATPIQNVGAYGQEVSETITRVRTVDRTTREIREFSGAECRFGYRDSLFKSEAPEQFVVVSVSFRLRPGAAPTLRYGELERALAADGARKPTLADVRKTVLAVRRSKSMVLDAEDENGRSCGSFFTNPIVSSEELARIERLVADPSMPRYPQPDGRVKLSAAWLIERAGLSKGERLGNAGLSTRHALAVVAHPGATAGDVVRFAAHVRRAVLEKFGVRLVPEPVFWGFGGDPLAQATA